MKKSCLAVLTVFLYSTLTAQVVEEKFSNFSVKNLHNDINSESQSFTFHSSSYKHFADQSSIDYLQKSKNQKTWAWILTGVGATVITVGLLTQDYADAFSGIAEEKNSTSPVVYAVGGACIAGGIVLFGASSRNKKKAINSSGILRMEKAVVPEQNSTAINNYPAVGVRINFR